MDPTSRPPTTGDRRQDGEVEEEDDEGEEEECCDVEAWETLTRSLKEVQSVLDYNRRLIQQVNDNHRSKIPYNLTKNVDLICQINANMSTVVSLYSSLSDNFGGIVRQRRALAASADDLAAAVKKDDS